MNPHVEATPSDAGHGIPFAEALRTWVRVGLESFGGPAGQIAVMHRILVEEKRWVSEERFLHALSYCMLLPGPEAQQLATYIGWLLHRTRGGLTAGLLFVLPGFVTILLLSLLYAAYGNLPLVAGIFFGIKPAVLALVLEALLRISRRALRHRVHGWIAATAFVAIFFLRVPFPLIVFGAAALGFALQRLVPTFVPENAPVSSGAGASAVVDAMLDREIPEHARTSGRRTIRVAAVWGTLWATPIVVLLATLGGSHVFTQIAIFFSKMAVVTFGGAYAVLAYVAQQAVDHHGWLRPGEMLDGLGMAETTPGPLIQVVQFVGFLAAYRQPGALTPWVAGTLAAVITTWVTYVPCFLWIFLGAPYVERLRSSRVLRGALAAITAAIVGVVLNLTVWFSLHVLFGTVRAVHAGPLLLQLPAWETVNVAAVAIAIVAAVATLRFHVGMFALLGGSAVAGVLWHFRFGA
jgi:chromate transporter